MRIFEEKIVTLRQVRKKIFLLGLKSSYLAPRAQPGQFVNIYLQEKGVFLPRPFSIHKIESDIVYLLFKVRGKATQALADMAKGESLRICGPLGKKFDWLAMAKYKRVVLIGGGIGIAPLSFLGEKLASLSSQKLLFVGAATKKELVVKKELRNYGFMVYTATLDGSAGEKGDVVSVFSRWLEKERIKGKDLCVFGCGPWGMAESLQRVERTYKIGKVWFSFERVIACGLGVCRGCAIETKSGYKLLCQQGPVFNLDEVVFA